MGGIPRCFLASVITFRRARHSHENMYTRIACSTAGKQRLNRSIFSSTTFFPSAIFYVKVPVLAAHAPLYSEFLPHFGTPILNIKRLLCVLAHQRVGWAPEVCATLSARLLVTSTFKAPSRVPLEKQPPPVDLTDLNFTQLLSMAHPFCACAFPRLIAPSPPPRYKLLCCCSGIKILKSFATLFFIFRQIVIWVHCFYEK